MHRIDPDTLFVPAPGMLFTPIMERFVRKAPVSVMVRGALEYALAPEAIDQLFRSTATEQYEKKLLFSAVVDLMGMVVARVQPSLNAAFRAVADTLPVSLTALYDKVDGTESAVSAALVRHTALRLAPVVSAMGALPPARLPGCRVRFLDGNHLASTERRLDVHWQSSAGPLPGQALVFLDASSRLVTHMIPCEDGHALERSLTPEILSLVEAKDCVVADRNFCTFALLSGIAKRQAFFAIRHHANLRIVSAGTPHKRGRTDTGEVFEQEVTLEGEDGRQVRARRVAIQVDKPTRDGDTELAIITNVPTDLASALVIAELYRERWTIETMFFEITQMLDGELNTMGYPRAALLAFAIALASYNLLSTVKSALRAAHGAEMVDNEVSSFYLANEARTMHEGLDVATDPEDWEPFRTMEPAVLAAILVKLAGGARLPAYKRHKRGPKKPVPRRTKNMDSPHVSTARLLLKARGKVTP